MLKMLPSVAHGKIFNWSSVLLATANQQHEVQRKTSKKKVRQRGKLFRKPELNFNGK